MFFIPKTEAKSPKAEEPVGEILNSTDSTSASSASEKSKDKQTDVTESNYAEAYDTIGVSKEWGYDLYPERRGADYRPKWAQILLGLEGREGIDKIKCERNVYWCVQNSPLVKLMMGALRSSGCPIDLQRHISCEICDTSVTGGYDPILNQVIICQNMAKDHGIVQGILTHEMIHMFDYCNNDVDFRNIDHLACTEVRAANLAHCSFLSAMLQGDASIFNIKQAHQNCVKSKALASLMAVRNMPKEAAVQAVERVFPKCYNDLEPIGRRVKRNSNDQHRAYRESPMYGYGIS